jgi:uncharacterized membrane protein YtjA (UPF0391 family)
VTLFTTDFGTASARHVVHHRRMLIASLLGFFGTYAIGAYAHVLLVAAVVLFVVGLMTGRRSLA